MTASAFSSVVRLMKSGTYEQELQKDFEIAVYNFAVGKGCTMFKREYSKKLVGASVAAVVVNDTKAPWVEAILDEPIFVERRSISFVTVMLAKERVFCCKMIIRENGTLLTTTLMAGSI